MYNFRKGWIRPSTLLGCDTDLSVILTYLDLNIHVILYCIFQKRLDKAIYTIGIRLHSLQRRTDSTDEDSNKEGALYSDADKYIPATSRRMRPPDSELRIALMFSFLLVFFVVTWVPMFLLDTLMYFGLTFSMTAVNYTVLLSHCNSSFNPLLYRFQSDFRHIFFMWICSCRRWRRRRRGSEIGSINGSDRRRKSIKSTTSQSL